MTLILFLIFKWSSLDSLLYDIRLTSISDIIKNNERRNIHPYAVALILFSCNFFGLLFAKGLHR